MSGLNKRQRTQQSASSEIENQKDWDDYFMGIASLVAKKSKDPSTQVGACIVNRDNKIVGTGFNGMPRGRDEDFTWARKSENPDNKHLYVCHAELNAIVNKNQSDLKGCRIYVTLFPCNECAKLIIQSGIEDVIYKSDIYADQIAFQASRKIFETLGITPRECVPKKFQ
nr:deoxycytidylate deaminase-like [Onthophagus taurus]